MNPAFKDTVWAPRPACCYDPPTVVAPLTVQRGHSDPYDAISETYGAQAAVNAATQGSEAASGSAAHSILTEAAGIVKGARNSTHGDKERSFQVIANLWNAYLSGRKVQGSITPFDVAQFMVLLKIGRSIQGKPVRDHFVDAAGYSAIAGELSA